MPYVSRNVDGTVYGRWATAQFGGQEWLDDGHPDLSPTIQEIEKRLETAVDLYVDSVARARRFGTATASPTTSCLSYQDSAVPEWKAQADAFSAWRDSVILYAIQQADLVYHGLRGIPTEEELVAEIDANLSMVWPA